MTLNRTRIRAALLGLALVVAACNTQPAGTDAAAPGAPDEHDSEHHHEHEARVPNNGAVVRIAAPAAGETLTGGEVVVVIEVENFELGTNDNHWHVYVDGTPWAKVPGNDTDVVVRGLEPGEHEISVYLFLGTDEQLEEGATVTVSVAEP